MDLKSGYPFWAIRNGLMQAFPPLQQDLQCEVAVIGGGITAALIADQLVQHGHEVAVIEQRDIGWGSTAASTALLQYEIDTPLRELAKRYGLDAALLAYRACAQAINDLRVLATQVGEVDFRSAQSLYYASRRRDLRPLLEEFELRARHGFAVDWLDAQGVAEDYGFSAPGAILTTPAASMDPYRMAYRLLDRVQAQGGRVHDRCRVSHIESSARQVHLRTTDGVNIRCRHLVIAAGYATQHWLQQRVARNRSSYAFVTDPLPTDTLGPLRDTMMWETARPYLYLRSTADDRLLIGGEDDAVDLPLRRDAQVDRKARRLADKVGKLFPQLPIQPTFAWAGTFAETEDGLPFFGAHPQWGPRVQFAMAYGGNGITYSMIGAGLVRAAIERRRHPLAQLFSFQRLD
ncbi:MULTISPECIES: FAD-dependent oxidoreductase [Stenotrophomonas]|uniref:NAD(P)/FAD-dependent oxidoreductase n=1 Tax=Stenotrophomonas TaxID=40323 RepID=UPI00076FF5A8|nr:MULTISPECIES: FAD-dependent oxidoreductase [Stenotrophomonas]AMJ57964.1 amino acid oxidase [Stenotrophomonas sp. KCTC 12332]